MLVRIFVKEKQFYDHSRKGDCAGCQRELLLHFVGLRHKALFECEEMITDLMNRLAVRKTLDELNKNLPAENDEIDAKMQEFLDRLNKKQVTEGDEYERKPTVSVPVPEMCEEIIDVEKCEYVCRDANR